MCFAVEFLTSSDFFNGVHGVLAVSLSAYCGQKFLGVTQNFARKTMILFRLSD